MRTRTIYLTETMKYEIYEPGEDDYAAANQRIFSSDGERKIAGNRRVAKIKEKQADTNDNVPVSGIPGSVAFQSITIQPQLRGISFEELRLECYRQSQLVTGISPQPNSNPEMVIPPLFDAAGCRVDEEEEENADLFLSEIIMSG